jgi:hypothetical protein
LAAVDSSCSTSGLFGIHLVTRISGSEVKKIWLPPVMLMVLLVVLLLMMVISIGRLSEDHGYVARYP